MKKLLGPLLAAIAALLLAVPLATADTYTVTRTDDPVPGACLPDDCSLREALTASNGSATVDDVVVIPANPAPYLVNYEMLTLPVTDEVEIRGDGADRSIVEGDGKAVIFSVGSPGVVVSGITIRKGAGAFQNNGNLTLRGVSVENNKREGAGGGIQNNGSLLVESSFFGFNSTAGISGGAIQANGSVTVVNSTFTRNSSNASSAILGNGAVTISSSTIAFNESGSTTAPAVGAKPLTVRDSVFSANTNLAGVLSCGSIEPIVSLGGNVADDASCGTTATDRPNVNPLLGSLALHGGPTQLYDLLPGSPAIDAAGQCPALDQRGAPRPQGAACDSGAYESTPVSPPPPPPPPADKEFFMRLGKKLLLKKGAIWVRLTCPKSEVSPPCRGKAVVADPPLDLGEGVHTLQARPLSGQFKIRPGKTRWVPLRKPRENAKLLPDGPGEKKVTLLVRAKDGAGNSWSLKKRLKLRSAG